MARRGGRAQGIASARPADRTARTWAGFRRISACQRGASARCGSKLKEDPAVALKRQLWAQLLKLVYGREVETDALFFQHTFLVIVAKAIALAVLGLRDDDPRHVLSGAAFEAAGIFGAAESDFFDWVVAEPDGEALVRRILGSCPPLPPRSSRKRRSQDSLRIADRPRRAARPGRVLHAGLAGGEDRAPCGRATDRTKGARSSLRLGHLSVSRRPQLHQGGRRRRPGREAAGRKKPPTKSPEWTFIRSR